MRPYYQDDLVTIYHGDSHRWEFEGAIDVVVTDPPYGIAHPTNYAERKRGRLGRTSNFPAVLGDDQPFQPATILNLNLPTVLFGANHYADRLPASPSWIVWDKRIREGVGVNDQADCELAWTNLGGPARVFRHMWNGMWRDSERGESYHPMQKPAALMRWVLAKCPPGTIFDPYMGSGPVLVAAKSLNRRAIGIEIEERYCEIAARRCSQEVLGLVSA